MQKLFKPICAFLQAEQGATMESRALCETAGENSSKKPTRKQESIETLKWLKSFKKPHGFHEIPRESYLLRPLSCKKNVPNWLGLLPNVKCLVVDWLWVGYWVTHRRVVCPTSPVNCLVVGWLWSGCGLVVDWLLSDQCVACLALPVNCLVVGWLWTGYWVINVWLAWHHQWTAWLWAGCGLVVGWLWTGYWVINVWACLASPVNCLVVGWLWTGCGLVVDWLLSDQCVACLASPVNCLVVGWLWAGYWVTHRCVACLTSPVNCLVVDWLWAGCGLVTEWSLCGLSGITSELLVFPHARAQYLHTVPGGGRYVRGVK